MNSDHLGDSLDFAKGAILRLTMPLLNSLVVIPMLTDQPRWTKRHFALYAGILGLPVERILLRRQTFYARQRQEYFSKVVRRLPAHSDIFLDPDTGFRRQGGNAGQSVRCSDIVRLLGQDPERVIVIYCYRRTGVGELEQSLEAAVNGGRYGFAYAGGPASMMFLSNNVRRLRGLHSHLSRFLAPMDGTRLTRILPAPSDNDA